MQWLANTNQLGEFYGEIKKLIGTTSLAKVPLKPGSGEDLLKSKEEVLMRWAEHFNALLNLDRSADLEHVRSIPQLPIHVQLDEPLRRGEVILAVKQQQNNRAVGIDFIPGELLKYGGEELHSAIWELFPTDMERRESPISLYNIAYYSFI